MPDVNKALQNWRSALSAEEAIDQAVLNELQDHLEAELARLPADILDENERVLIAARRVGAPDVLGRQFAADRAPLIWARRLYWAAIGVLAVALMQNMAGIAEAGFIAAFNALPGIQVSQPQTSDGMRYFSISAVWGVVAVVLLIWRRGFFRPRRIGLLISTHPFITICTGMVMLTFSPFIYYGVVRLFFGDGVVFSPFDNVRGYFAEEVFLNLGPLVIGLVAWRIMQTAASAARTV